MSDSDEVKDFPFDGAYTLAILYTIGYLGMVGLLFFVEIPKDNRDIVMQLIGIMSAAQLGIVKYYYDGSKAAEKAQNANLARASRTDNVVQELARSAPSTVASAVAAASGTGPGVVKTEKMEVNAGNVDITERKE